MMSASAYKVIHLFGIFLVLMAFGGVIMRSINGGTGEHNWKKQIGIGHGVGLFLILLGGFGMMAKYNYAYGDGWVIAKIVIWLVFGGLLTAATKMTDKGTMLWWAVIILATLSGYLAIFKPF